MYKIDRYNLKKEKSFHRMFFLAGLFFFIVCNAAISAQGFYGMDLGGDQVVKDNPIPLIIFITLFTGLFMYVGFNGMRKVDQKIIRYENLARYGTLSRGHRYSLEPTGSSSNGNRIMKIVVDYELPSGSLVRLESDGRYDLKVADSDGLVDVLIDLNDPNNYYIDFNIEEETNGAINYN